MNGREHWGTRIGLILAMAGSAVGLGNFLRFPGQAASHGGGAFMIPYFVALVLIGMPLMWVEWAIGRYGGIRGHGTSPGIFRLLWPSRFSKYLGVLGVALPLIVLIYYAYIESWALAYSYFSLTGAYSGIETREGMGAFLEAFQGANGFQMAYVFLGITLLMNFAILYRGVSRGIELMAKIAMPTLLVIAVILVIRVFTLGAPIREEWSLANGLAFLWNPQLRELGNFDTWLAAAGQVFFTLSVGFGVIATYASYLREKDDVALSGLTTATTNEFAEIVLGSSLAIPLAFMFFGPIATQEIARAGIFDLGFMSLPLIFGQLPLGTLLGTLWFGLLFFAGITSSVSLAQPAIAFLEDELGLSRQKAVIGLFLFILAAIQPVILAPGFLGELDFWAGTVGIVLFGAIQVILFAWIFGMAKGWPEITRGADIRVPRVFYYVLKYVTPVYLIVLLVGWAGQESRNVWIMKDVPTEHQPYIWGARILIGLIILILLILIALAGRLRKEATENA